MITVVSDTSPLVALAFLGLEPLIPQLFDTVYIGPIVAAELASRRFGFDGVAAGLRFFLSQQLYERALSAAGE